MKNAKRSKLYSLMIATLITLGIFAFNACDNNTFDARVTGITAEFTQGSLRVYPDTQLSAMIPNLVVHINYDDGKYRALTVTAGMLSGELTIGDSTITVTYLTFTDAFTVYVSDPTVQREIYEIAAEFTQGSLKVYPDTLLSALLPNVVVTVYYDDGTHRPLTVTADMLSGTFTVGDSTITVTYLTFTDAFTVYVSAPPQSSGIAAEFTQHRLSVFTTTPLSVLIYHLIVTVNYDDGSSRELTVTPDMLSGELTIGDSIIIVSYAEFSDDFTVNVSPAPAWGIPTPFVPQAQITAGASNSFAIDADGYLWGWGQNSRGSLDGTTDIIREPTRLWPGLLPRVARVRSSGEHTLVIDEYGRLWGWGRNNHGQARGAPVGQDNITTPENIMPGRRFIEIATGFDSSFAIDENGGLWVWGRADRYSPRLGDGFTVSRQNPVQVRPGTRFIAVSAWHTGMGLTYDGKLYIWGSNVQGQTATGTWDWYGATHHTVPTLMGNRRFTAASVINAACFALDTTGKLWAWGNGQGYMMGNGIDRQHNHFPIQVEPGRTFRSINASGNHATWSNVAIDDDGILWGWGFNQRGQLGNGEHGDAARVRNPAQIMPSVRFSMVAAGAQHKLAMDEDGNIWGFGTNTNFEIGTGDKERIPTQAWGGGFVEPFPIRIYLNP